MNSRAYAKVNIFLKIVGTRGDYHQLRSRFVRVAHLYDTLTFEPKAKPTPQWELSSNIVLPEHNTLTHAYTLLKELKPRVQELIAHYRIILTKQIPLGAGLGGGSSDAALFLKMCNQKAHLGLSTETLASIGQKIGADVPFFVYGYPSANVEGIGERIVPFDEEPPLLSLTTPPVVCNTAKVYRTFRARFIASIDPNAAQSWLQCPSKELLQTLTPREANDLYPAALAQCPTLKDFAPSGHFLSGSGSTFFTLSEV